MRGVLRLLRMMRMFQMKTYGCPRWLRLRKSQRDTDARAENGKESRHHDEEQ